MTAYSITDLGTLQGDAPSPSAINAAGVITGGLMNRAFRYKSGTLAALQLPPSASDATAAGISSSNPEQIAGWIGPSVNCRAALWTDGVYEDLHPFIGDAYSLAADVNDGMIVTGFTDSRAFRLNVTTQQIETLTLPDNDVRPYAINNSGHVAGIAGKGDHTGPWLFYYDQSMHIVPIPGEVQWETVDVNDADVLTGSYRQPAPPYHIHAVTYDFNSQAFTDIHGGPYHGSRAVCINNHGAVVGSVGDSSVEDGMLWTASDGMRTLTDLVGIQSGWTFSGASAINDAGEITGAGVLNGQSRGFLLTPIPSKPKPVHEPNWHLKELVGMVKEILVAGSGMGILLPSGDIIYPGDGGPVDPGSPLLRLDAAQGDADVGLAMHVLARRISDPSTRSLAEKAAARIAVSAAQSAGSSKADTGRSNWLSRLLRDIADALER
jgi:uncharacterized membrane protein